jgi:hypothetical protein
LELAAVMTIARCKARMKRAGRECGEPRCSSPDQPSQDKDKDANMPLRPLNKQSTCDNKKDLFKQEETKQEE